MKVAEKMKKFNKKMLNYMKEVFEVDTLIYIVISILLPVSVIKIADVFPGDFVTLVFLIVTALMYFICVILISPIVETNRQLRAFLKKSSKCTNYKEFCEILKEKKYYKLTPLFNEYNKTVKVVSFKKGTETKKRYVSSMESSYYLDEENLIDNDLKTRTIDQISQSLTGVGIFGTFLGIVRGVSGLNLESSEAMKSGIATLLSGVKVSFNSSLYGILTSVIVILIYKGLIDITLDKINRLNSRISQMVLLESEEEDISSLREEIKSLKSSIDSVLLKNNEAVSKVNNA